MKGKLRIIIAVLLIFVALALMAWIRPWSSSDEASRLLYGNVDYRDVQLAFRAAGRLEAMLVDEGEQAKAMVRDAQARSIMQSAESSVRTLWLRQIAQALLPGRRPRITRPRCRSAGICR
jgi:hypothetical protein